jgi:hypothetical protein
MITKISLEELRPTHATWRHNLLNFDDPQFGERKLRSLHGPDAPRQSITRIRQQKSRSPRAPASGSRLRDREEV